MRNLFLSLIVLLCVGTMRGIPAEPDFAYPRTVLSDARKDLSRSGRQGPEAALSMLEITVATLSLDNDSVFLLPAEIHSLAESQKSNAVKSLLMLMEAQTLQAIYNNKRWQYDRTETPDEPLPDNVALWNGHQFKNRINALVINAYETACSDPRPLDDFSNIIKADRIARLYYPTIRDFIALKGIVMLNFDSEDELAFTCNSIIEKEIALSTPGSYSQINWLSRQTDQLQLYGTARRERLLSLYNRYSEHEASCQLLQEYISEFSCRDITPAAVAMARDAIERYPQYWNINALRNSLDELLRPWISYNAPATCIPGKEFELSVEYGNITGKGGIVVYRGNNNSTSGSNPSKAVMTEIARFNVTPRDSAPYQAKTTFRVTASDEVYYFIRSSLNDSLCDKRDAKAILCTSLTPVIVNGCTENAVMVADASTGRPVQGVNVRVGRNGRNAVAPLNMGKTDDEGALRFRLPRQLADNGGRRYLQLVNKGKTYDFGQLINVAPYARYNNGRTRHNALIFTDRALYHPGDTIKWAAVISSYSPKTDTSELCRGENVSITLYDANHTAVADTTLKTDDFGRIHGFSIATADGLTGTYSLEAKYTDSAIGFASVEVSDFRLPRFMVKIDSTMRNCPSAGSVTLHGNASTYSMMPVADAAVLAEIKSASRYRWFVPEKTIGYIRTVTDAAGDFTIVVTDSILKLTSLDCYVADIQVTAADGESRRTSASFTTGKPFEIVLDGKAADCADSLSLPAVIYNADGVRQNKPLVWTLLSDNNEIASGTAQAPEYKVGWQNIPSGDYTLKAATADTALADNATATISLYNTRLGTMSASRPLFVPEKNLSFAHGHSGELLYGVPEDTYLYMTLGVDSLLVSVEGLETSAGFHKLKLTLPEGYEQGRLSLYAVKNGIVYSENIDVTEKVDRSIAIEGESFRDKTAPGNIEHWRLKLTSPESKKHIESAAIATAYNKALSALAPLSWPAKFRNNYSWISINAGSYSSMSWLSGYYSMLAKTGKPLPSAAFEYPALKYPVSYRTRLMIRGARNAAGAVSDYVVQEKYMSAATSDMAASNNSATIESEEAADEDAGAPGEAPDTEAITAEYRPSEVLQALWMPSLTSDSNGNIDIEFTVPQATTTWAFQTFAWDNRLNSGSFIRDVVAQKPVMVQPNLPRFLRAGDSATVLASVFNNSGSADSICTTVEIFNPATGEILYSTSTSLFVENERAAIASLPIEAPDDMSAIGYRIRSSLGKFTDGEQAIVPVLPASVDVMESDIFSMTSNTTEASLDLPKARDQQLVLEFCSNPAWDVIKALPSLYETKASTADAAVRQLFRAAVSGGMLKSYPRIASTLRQALDSPGDSSLISQLEKNDNLKLATLRQTPWVQAAASQTARMARLELLFDSKAVNADINDALRVMAKLQNSDGGWRWGEWSDESSEWTTRTVLLALGRLNALGYTPDDRRISPMIANALKFCESQLGDTETDIQLTWIHTLLPDYKPGLKAKKVIDATVQQITSGWRRFDVGGKARAAMILRRHGYKNIAAEVMNSIAEFAQTEKDGAIFFPSVNDIDQYAAVLFTWADIEPDAPIIDGLRQWLVMRSQRTDAMASCDATALIAAFLRSGSDWTVPAQLPDVRLGEKTLELPAAESMTGHFTMTIDNCIQARRLTISRNDPSNPAWGALLSRYSGQADRIKASSCSTLSIDKQLSVLRNGKWQYADEIKLGERVRVVLTIKANEDLQFVTITDARAAGLEPVDQLPGYIGSAGVRFYRENNDTDTRLFIGWLPRGTYSLSYELTANMAGSFISGIAAAQSQYAPSVTAHSSGYRLTVAP